MSEETDKNPSQPDWILDLEKQNAAAFANVRRSFNKANAGEKKRPAISEPAIARMMARGRKKTSRSPSPENE